MDQFTLEKISSLDWASLSKRLKGLAVYWSKRFFGSRWNNLPKGMTHDDIVQDAIRRAFSRDWKAFDLGEFESCLFSSVQSVTSNLKKSYTIQKTDAMDLFTLQAEDDDHIEDTLDKADVQKQIEERLTNDDRLRNTYKLLCNGHDPREIAELLSVGVTEVYNMNKRIVRIVEQLAQEINGS